MGQLSRLVASSGTTPRQAVKAENSTHFLHGGARSLRGWISCQPEVDEHISLAQFAPLRPGAGVSTDQSGAPEDRECSTDHQ
jgi:hypothetical protein